ncbi:MAG: DNA repair protein RadC [Oligoflexia bacterium]|nr:DNA repair protein RadC [Oligoflexia bacterium]
MRARERYAVHGPGPLSDEDLLALAIGTGVSTRPASAIAHSLIAHCGDLAAVADAPVHMLSGVCGVGPARAVRLHASLALARRALQTAQPAPRLVIGPADAWAHLGPLLQDHPVEQLHALYLGARGRVLGHRVLTSGSDRHTIVDPRQVFRPAVQLGAASVIVAHNHPSGDPTPSEPDVDVTRRLAAAGRVLGIALIDHLVIGRTSYRSLAEQGVLPQWQTNAQDWVSDRD